jgi:hypothetical protein
MKLIAQSNMAPVVNQGSKYAEKNIAALDITSTELLRIGKIKPITKEYCSKLCDSVDEVLGEIKMRGTTDQEILSSTAAQIREFHLILSAIKSETTLTDHMDYFKELISKISGISDYDLWIVLMPFKVPRCLIYESNGKMCYIIEIPDKKFLDSKYIGIMAHEVAHLHEVVRNHSSSRNPDKRKIGEILADAIGFCAVELLYSDCCAHYIKTEIGFQNLRVIAGNTHPSWYARVAVLNYLTDDIWSHKELRDRNSIIFKDIIAQSSGTSSIEESIISKSLKNARESMSNWIKCKESEEELLELATTDNTQALKLNPVQKRIRELINT